MPSGKPMTIFTTKEKCRNLGFEEVLQKGKSQKQEMHIMITLEQFLSFCSFNGFNTFQCCVGIEM